MKKFLNNNKGKLAATGLAIGYNWISYEHMVNSKLMSSLHN